MSGAQGTPSSGHGSASAEGEASPRTRFRGSLMLTVWSWEAERELFMERSAVEWQRGCCITSNSLGA